MPAGSSMMIHEPNVVQYVEAECDAIADLAQRAAAREDEDGVRRAQRAQRPPASRPRSRAVALGPEHLCLLVAAAEHDPLADRRRHARVDALENAERGHVERRERAQLSVARRGSRSARSRTPGAPWSSGSVVSASSTAARAPRRSSLRRAAAAAAAPAAAPAVARAALIPSVSEPRARASTARLSCRLARGAAPQVKADAYPKPASHATRAGG